MQNVEDIKAGDLVESIAGHDKSKSEKKVRIFAVLKLKVEKESGRDVIFAYIADGRSRKVEKPKRKKIKHLKLYKNNIFMPEFSATENINKSNNKKINNAFLRKIISANFEIDKISENSVNKN